MTLPEPFRWEDDHVAGDLPGATVVFSSRHGGVSGGAFASLNLGLLTDDAPENVRENRAPAGAAVGFPWERFCYGRQVHGTTRPPRHRAAVGRGPYTQEDGQATALDDAAAIVFTADCLPVMLAADGAVAALHCGWRPLAGGILAEGVQALRELGARRPAPGRHRPRRARLLLRGGRGGPRALRRRYDARRGGATSTSPPWPARNSRREGVEVHDTGLCTICDERFFSHRRDHGVTGRQAGVVCRA